MSKERLEELLELHEKAVVAYEDCDFLEMRGYLETLFLEGFTDYLIEQAERVQELEEEIFQLKDDVNRMENEYLHGIKVENKRYREVINNINEKAMLYGVDEQVYEAIKEAIKALEE